MKSLLKSLAVTAAVMGLAATSQATPTLRLTSGLTVVTVADGSGSDGSTTAGIVVYNGAVGDWTINITTGVTKPANGTAATPFISLTTVSTTQNTVTAPADLKIEFSETGFGPTKGHFMLHVGGTLQGSVSQQFYADTGNTLFGTGTLLHDFGSFSDPSYNADSTASGLPGTYSITEVMTLSHGTGDKTSSPSMTLTTVPDGGTTLMLLGSAVTTLGLLRRRFIKA